MVGRRNNEHGKSKRARIIALKKSKWAPASTRFRYVVVLHSRQARGKHTFYRISISDDREVIRNIHS